MKEKKYALQTTSNILFSDSKEPKISVAMDWFYRHSYYQRLDSAHYQPFSISVPNRQLKQFGVGIFFYLEFKLLLTKFLFVMAIISLIPIIYNFFQGGDSMVSLSGFLLRVGIANNLPLKKESLLLQIIVQMVMMLMCLSLFVYWKIIKMQELLLSKDQYLKDRVFQFCIAVQNVPQQADILQIQTFFSKFGKVRQVTKVYDFGGQIRNMKELADLCVLIPGQSNDEKSKELKVRAIQLQQQILQANVKPSLKEVIVHFSRVSSKRIAQIYLKQNYQTNSFYDRIMRYFYFRLFERQPVLFHSNIILLTSLHSNPQNINWQNHQTHWYSKALRLLLVLLIVLAMIIIMCVWVSWAFVLQNSNSCNQVVKQEQATTSATLFCFCSQNLQKIFTDKTISKKCSESLDSVLISTGISFMTAIVSGVLNFLTCLLINKSTDFLRFDTKSRTKFTFTLISLIVTLVNSTLIQIVSNLQNDNFYSPAFFFQKILASLDLANTKYRIYKDLDAQFFYIVNTYFFMLFITDIITVILDAIIVRITSCLNECFICFRQSRSQYQLNMKVANYEFDYCKQVVSHTQMFITLMVMASGMPILYILAFLSNLIRYVCSKYLILNHSTIIKGISMEYLIIQDGLVLACAFHCFLSVVIHTAVFSPELFLSFSLASSQNNVALNRFLLDSITFLTGLVLCLGSLLTLGIAPVQNWIAKRLRSRLNLQSEQQVQKQYQQLEIRGVKSYEMSLNAEYAPLAALIKKKML